MPKRRRVRRRVSETKAGPKKPRASAGGAKSKRPKAGADVARRDPLAPQTVEAMRRARRTAVKSDRDRRLAAFDAAIGAGRAAGPPMRAGAGRPALRILAEGDSWFDFPFGGAPFENGDVIARLGHMIPFPILNEAHRGDETRQMLGVEQRKRLRGLLNDAQRDFNVLLFSGGGNDIVGDPFCLWLNDSANVGGDPTQGINRTPLDHALAVVRHAYEELFALRDAAVAASPGRTIHVFLHAYDFANPTGDDVCGIGPWLKPSLDDRGWTTFGEAKSIVRDCLAEFGDIMAKLEQAHADTVYIRTQGTLTSAADWHDELHPSRQGFGKIAQKFKDALAATFPAAFP